MQSDLQTGPQGLPNVSAGRPEFGLQLHALRVQVLAATTGARTTVANRYVLGRTLGSGASGIVFEAEDLALCRRVAVKLFKTRDPSDDLRVVREAQILARFAHEHVVQVFEVGLRDGGSGSPYVVMEYIQGATLRAWLDERPRSVEAVVAVLVQAAHGLAAAHRAGIVHRDFKPANVLVGLDGRARVVDFGLARSADADDPSTTPNGMEVSHDAPLSSATISAGTPAYMAPEAFDGEATPASDQYALCVVLYEALLGERPYVGDSLDALREHQQAREVVVPRRGVMPRRIAAAVQRGLRRDPTQRFASISALTAALQGRPRRRWLGVLSATGLVGAAAAGALWLAAAGPATPCVTGRAAWAPLGPTTALTDVIQAPLDRYTEDWLAAEVAQCAATPDALPPAVRDCLDRKLLDARALIELSPTLDRTDHASVARALEMLAAPAQCQDADAAGFVAPPAAMTATVAAAQHKLARLRALADLSQSEDALALARTLLPEVRAIGFAPLTVETASIGAHLLLVTAAYDDARAMYEECFFAAQDASLDWWAAQCASALTMVTGDYLGDTRQGRRWAGYAEAAFERAGYAPMQDTQYLQGLLRLARREGDRVEQARLARLGLQVARAAERDDTGRVQTMLAYLGDAQFAQEDYQAAIDSFAEAAQIHERTKGYGSVPQAQMVDYIGAALAALDRPDQALEKRLEALRMREATLSPENVEIAYSHSNTALSLAHLGRGQEALAHSSQALSILIAHHGPDHTEVGQGYMARAEIYEQMGPASVADALAAYQHALVLLDPADPEKASVIATKLAELRAQQAPGEP